MLENALPGAAVYTDGANGYEGIPFEHKAVRHQSGEYVRGEAHTLGIENFWALLKRAYKGVYYEWSPRHLNCYLVEFAGRLGLCQRDLFAKLGPLADGMVGKRLTYLEFTASNGRNSGARPMSQGLDPRSPFS